MEECLAGNQIRDPLDPNPNNNLYYNTYHNSISVPITSVASVRPRYIFLTGLGLRQSLALLFVYFT